MKVYKENEDGNLVRQKGMATVSGLGDFEDREEDYELLESLAEENGIDFYPTYYDHELRGDIEIIAEILDAIWNLGDSITAWEENLLSVVFDEGSELQSVKVNLAEEDVEVGCWALVEPEYMFEYNDNNFKGTIPAIFDNDYGKYSHGEDVILQCRGELRPLVLSSI